MNDVQLLLIIGAGIAVAAIAHKRDIEPGMIIVILAAAASFIPGMPRLELDSELILAVVVPPLLYSATRGTSLAAFGANLRAILAPPSTAPSSSASKSAPGAADSRSIRRRKRRRCWSAGSACAATHATNT